ncbi:hypothetical protein A2U01_0099759, partial [Trifolium medium]|nr:hypothetical protein [Trifolium medium]
WHQKEYASPVHHPDLTVSSTQLRGNITSSSRQKELFRRGASTSLGSPFYQRCRRQPRVTGGWILTP